MRTKRKRTKVSNRTAGVSKHRGGSNSVFGRMIMNALMSRSLLAEGMKSGKEGIDPPGRDLDYECGYPSDPSIFTYRRLYEREGYPKRVVDVWSDECWSVRPELYETEESRVTKFERAWDKLNQRINCWHYLHRLDRICGIGSFGILLLGLDDGQDFRVPVAGINRRGELSKKGKSSKPINLLYVKPFAEDHVRIAVTEDDRTNPRFGQPRWYDIQLTIPGYPEDGESSASSGSIETETVRVHWTRIIHVADNCESADIFGVPRMRPVLNRLLDIRKTLGGSAEMFWKGAFPGYSFETVPELLGESVMDEESVREQFEEYMEGLKRYLALDGVKVNQLFPQVADPTAHVEQQVAAICACIGVPMRIFMGSESGHLASTQDSINMNKRVSRRQTLFCEPALIRQFVDRLILIGVLPEPSNPDKEYCVSWSDLNTMSDKDKALVTLQQLQALMQYCTGQVETILPEHELWTIFMGLSEEKAKAIEAASAANKLKKTDPLGTQAAVRDANLQIKVAKAAPRPVAAGSGKSPSKGGKPQGGGRKGKPARTQQAGRPAGKIQQNRLSRKVRYAQA